MAYNQQPKAEFGIITKSKTLVEYTVRVTTSSKFPKKYRFVYGNRIMDSTMDILDFVVEANESNIQDPREFADRQYYQKRVLTRCKTTLNLIEAMLASKAISTQQCAEWSRLVLDVRNMTLAWRNKDLARAQQIPQ
ncbi:MAG: four helix bundle protein [Eubacteriales bacterium]